jgi:hypothetical protein
MYYDITAIPRKVVCPPSSQNTLFQQIEDCDDAIQKMPFSRADNDM